LWKVPNVMGACRQPRETTLLLTAGMPRLQPQRPHSIGLRQSVPRTSADPPDAQHQAARGNTKPPACTVLIFACLVPSYPHRKGCCDDRLRTPWLPLSL
jgi:hypothetical protein